MIQSARANKGFSLIEFLFYLFIILLLVYASFTYYQSKLTQKRDEKRMTDIAVIEKALSSYYQEYQKYPEVGEWECLEKDLSEKGVFSQEIKKYLEEIPNDPKFDILTTELSKKAKVKRKIESSSTSNPIFCYHYKTADNGKEYKIYYFKEKKKEKKYELVQIYSSGGERIYLGLGEKGEIPWFDSNFKFRKKIKIDNLKIFGEIINFPLLLSLEDESIAKRAKEDGSDIIFVDSSSEKLEREIIKYSSSTGELLVWFKIPSGNNEFYVYYNNPNAFEINSKTTWNEDFILVSHFDEIPITTTTKAIIDKKISTSTIEIPATTFDSTNNNIYGLVQNGVVQGSAGVVLNSYKFDGDDDFVRFSTSTIFSQMDNLTVSFWIFEEEKEKKEGERFWWEWEEEKEKGILGWENDFSDIFQISIIKQENLLFRVNISNSIYELNIQTPPKNQWNYLAAVYDGENLAFYINGEEKAKLKVIKGELTRRDGEFFEVGRIYNNLYSFFGKIDELFISKKAFDSNWVKTSYLNQKEPKSFVKEISQEELY